VFLTNLQEIKSTSSRMLCTAIRNYRALAKLHQGPELQARERNSINAWVEGTLAYAIEQKRKDKSEKNRLELYLFRLLTIKYRVLHPLKGTSVVLDRDLQDILDHKVITAMQQVLSA
jgi:hypothetical protein